MFGEENDEGIIPRVCRNLITDSVPSSSSTALPSVALSSSTSSETLQSITFKVTYIEIFLEKVRDLLVTNSSSSTTSNLRVREHPTEGPFVDGALCLEIDNLEDCMKLIEIGNKNRMIASTKLNLQSSRSHAIFTLHCCQTRIIHSSPNEDSTASLETRDKSSNGMQFQSEQEVTEKSYTVTSKLNLIDLAGSENSIAAGTIGTDRLKEGAAINKSLLTLGRVIKTLAENSSKERKELTSVSPAATSSIAAAAGPSPSQASSESRARRRHSMLEKSSSDRNLMTPNSSSSSSPLMAMKSSEKRSSLSPSTSSRSLLTSAETSPSPSSASTTPPRSRAATGATGGGGLTMVPYRDSVLTYLLKESLGGNSKTTMIATIRPGTVSLLLLLRIPTTSPF
jgi:hypothetical protein